MTLFILVCLLLCFDSFEVLSAWKIPIRMVQSMSRMGLPTTFSQSFTDEMISPITLVVPIDESAQLENLKKALHNLKLTPHFIQNVGPPQEFVQLLQSQDPFNNVYIVDANTVKESDNWLNTINSMYFWFDQQEHESTRQKSIRHMCRYCLFLSTKDESGFSGNEYNYMNSPSTGKTDLKTPEYLYAKHFHNYQRLKKLIKQILMMHEYHPIDRNSGETRPERIIQPQTSSLSPMLYPASTSTSSISSPATSLPAYVEYGGGKYSHFLSLVYSRYSNKSPLLFLKQLREGIDAWEVRIDLLHPEILSSEYQLIQEITWLQSISPLPLIYTVRTMNQLGKFLNTDYAHLAALQALGLQTGIEYLDIEATLPAPYIQTITEKVSKHYKQVTRMIGSYHTNHSVSSDVLETMFEASRLQGQADIFKVVIGATTKEDNEMIHQVGQAYAHQYSKPYIGLCIHQLGAQSRILNTFFTPVTHAIFPNPAAPGQLTVKQIIASRITQQLLIPKQFHLFGNPIQHSLSPSMHNWAFQALSLPHRYVLNEQIDVKSYVSTLQSDDFGGASVTIPFKEQIIQYMDGLHVASQAIGAVNTIVPIEEEVVEKVDEVVTAAGGVVVPGGVDGMIPGRRPKVVRRRLIGYNTDWLGMYKPIHSLLVHKPSYRSMRTQQPVSSPVGVDGMTSPPVLLQGLVIGAGGTARAACYTIQQLGLSLIVTNRHYKKAVALAAQFGGIAIPMDELGHHSAISPKLLQVVISTIPATAKITLPEDLYTNQPIVLDVVYKPAKTLLLGQALAHQCHIIQGATMLLEQATEQFRLWQQRAPPLDEMRKAIFSDTEKIDSL